MTEARPIRYALIGAGNIAQVAVLPAFAHSKRSQLVAVISSDVDKRIALAEKYKLKLFGGYDALETILREGAVDALYIALPNSLHAEYAVRAADAGVNVLCEKPLATNVADCEKVAAACTRAGVKLMVAYRLHFEAANLKALELARSGKLGDLRTFSSVFGHVVRPGDIRDRPETGGGALLDLGVYCVNAVRNLFLSEPVLVFAMSQDSNGVDETTTAVLQFPGGRLAQFTVSNGIAGVQSYRVSGTEGSLRLEPAFEYSGKIELHLTLDGKQHSESFSKRDQFAPELDYFSRCIVEDLRPEPDAEEAILDARVMEAIRQSAASGKAVPLEPRVRARRPSIDQESKKPPVREQQPIHAPSPSLK